jgi:hypothetical protein
MDVEQNEHLTPNSKNLSDITSMRHELRQKTANVM